MPVLLKGNEYKVCVPTPAAHWIGDVTQLNYSVVTVLAIYDNHTNTISIRVPLFFQGCHEQVEGIPFSGMSNG